MVPSGLWVGRLATDRATFVSSTWRLDCALAVAASRPPLWPGGQGAVRHLFHIYKLGRVRSQVQTLTLTLPFASASFKQCLLDLVSIEMPCLLHTHRDPTPNNTLQGQNHGDAPAFCDSLDGGSLQHDHECLPLSHCSCFCLNPPGFFLLRRHGLHGPTQPGPRKVRTGA